MGRAKKPLVSNQIVLYVWVALLCSGGRGQSRFRREWAGAARRYLLIPPPGKKCPVHNPSFSADG